MKEWVIIQDAQDAVEEAIEERDRAVKERDRAVEERDRLITERNKDKRRIKELEAMLAVKSGNNNDRAQL